MSDFNKIMTQLQKKQYSPVYLLYGMEAYFIDKITDYITENVLSEAEKSFNQSVFYGRDITIGQILETAKRYPMMSEKQVVIIKEAQDLKNFEDLASYMEKPVSSTVLVIAYKYKKPDGRKKTVKNIKKTGVVFESKTIYESKMQEWVDGYIQQGKRKITPKATMLITDYIGTNLSLAANEIDKLFITVKEGETVDDETVSKIIGINKDYNDFELTKALGTKDHFKAMRIANYFSHNQKVHSIIVSISILGRFYTQIMLMHFSPGISQNEAARMLGVNPFFVKEYFTAKSNISGAAAAKNIELIRQYDLKSKGVNSGSTPHGELIKELVFKLLRN